MKKTHNFYVLLHSPGIVGLPERARAGRALSAQARTARRGRNDSRIGGRTGRSAAGRIQRKTKTGERCSGSRHLQRASGSPSNAANTGGLEKQPGIRDDHGAKGKSSQSTDSQLFTTGRTASVFGIPHGATVICPVWRLKYSGVFLARKIWSGKPRHRSSGSGRGLSGRSDIFMKQTQKDCKHSIRLLMPQFIRLWITTIHGKIPLQPIWTGSVSTTSISTQRETRLCPTSVKMKRSGRFRIR